MGEQKTKALMASGVALFVTGLVVLALFVIPAARHTQVAVAQGEDGAPGGEGEGEGIVPPEPGAEGEMPGMGGPAPGGAPAAAAPPAAASEPLEPSRPNPFEARAGGPAAEAAAAVAATRYGPDWSSLPISEHMGFVRPEIPPPPTPPAPVISAVPESEIRITSILWDASGQAQAAYEIEGGRSGVLKPGDRIQGSTVIEITRSGVKLQDQRSGAVQTLEIRSRSAPPSRPSGRRPRGGQNVPRGFPAAPPG